MKASFPRWAEPCERQPPSTFAAAAAEPTLENGVLPNSSETHQSTSVPSVNRDSARGLPEPAAPAAIDLSFESIDADLNIIWCDETSIWHSRLGSTISVIVQSFDRTSLDPTRPASSQGGPSSPRKQLDAKRLAWQGCLQPSGADTCSGHFEVSAIMSDCLKQHQELGETSQGQHSETFPLQKSPSGFSGSWTSRPCGEISFHAKWSSEKRPSLKRSAVRVFAQAASICVHPDWHEAHAAACELLLDQGKGGPPPRDVAIAGKLWTFSLTCGLRLRTASMQRLRCPSTLAAVETDPTGQSFQGIGPSPERWLPCISYEDSFDSGSRPAISEVSRAMVDLNAGTIWYTLKIQALPAKLSLSLVERSSCQPVKGSPQILDLLPQAVFRKPPRLAPLVSQHLNDVPVSGRPLPGVLAVRNSDEQDSIPERMHEERECDGRAGLVASFTSPVSAKHMKPSDLSAMQQKVCMQQMFRVRRPASVQETRSQQKPEANSQALLPRSSSPRPESPCVDPSEETQSTNLPMECRPQPSKTGMPSTILENTGVVPPGRYMPSQPLPCQLVVVRKKNKSKSPSKKHKHSRRWAEA